MLADSLEKGIRAADARTAIEEGQLVLTTPFSPHASFNVGMAMARNKLIYALSDFALVIASDAEKGGTWAGAEEALRAGWIPVFVVEGPGVPDGNRLLIITNKGTLIAIEAAREFKELARSPLGEKVFASPAFAQGRMFVRGIKHLICIGAKNAAPTKP